MAELVLTQKPNTKLEDYCEIYRIPKEMIPVLNNLRKSEHYMFQRAPVTETAGERFLTISTGYYSGTGAQAQRIDLTPVVRYAIKRTGLRYECFNDAPKKGVTGNKIKIWF